MKSRSMSQGFTLIELLVVISIIALLSSVVLAAVTTAKEKSADAALLASAREIKTLLELHRNENPSYSGLLPGWTDACSPGSFTGNYAAKMVQICNDVVSISKGSTGSGSDDIYVGRPASVSEYAYTIIIRLPYQSKQAGAARYLCMGSSGATTPGVPFGPWGEPGCYADPLNQ